jgi:hypothetical protein
MSEPVGGDPGLLTTEAINSEISARDAFMCRHSTACGHASMSEGCPFNHMLLLQQ